MVPGVVQVYYQVYCKSLDKLVTRHTPVERKRESEKPLLILDKTSNI